MRLLLDTRILLWTLDFDRLIIAAALTEPMKLLTADPVVAQHTDLAVLV
ncbi:hypothetical protein KVG96_07350 [Pseudomonas sp. COR58]|uniref:PIN domain-containing protein n=1 Tax=Pseudomonas ekonensis TaxID=2842353 RepID=A0ABS6PBA6_9PSED|nr:hypothetical protein [Pseudomonas ekonensis]